MNPWSNDKGCEIFFEQLAATDEHGNETARQTYSCWCRRGLNRDLYEELSECVRDARAHIEE